MRILISTFGQDDFDKVVHAMRQLPYEELVLLGTSEAIGSTTFRRLKELEEASGHEVLGDVVDEGGFMEIVDDISEALRKYSRGDDGKRNDVIMNISGGDKLLGDAALFAAFRLGVETYHCDERTTKLPVLTGLTARDRFTPSQIKFLRGIGGVARMFDELVDEVSPGNRQPVERVMRELKKAELIDTEVKAGKIVVSLSGQGAEVVRALNVL